MQTGQVLMRGSARPWWRSRWWMPGFSLFLGALILGAYWIGGDARRRLWIRRRGCAGALFLFGSRSETIRGLGGPGRDEGWAAIDTTATAFAGFVLIGGLIALWLWDVAHGREDSAYAPLCAVAGLAYLAAVAWQRFRR